MPIESEHAKYSTPLRSLMALLIILISLIALWFLHFGGITIFQPILDFYLTIGVMNLSLYVWLRGFSGFRLKSQWWFGLAIVTVQLAIFSAFRFDGFDGTGRFIAKWRWTQTPEQQVEEFRTASSIRSRSDVVLTQLPSAGEFDSPAFRGVKRDSVYEFPNAEVNFASCEIKEIWRRPIGRGWSSFSAIGEFCFTQEQIGNKELVVCYSLFNGELVWSQERVVRFEEFTSGSGPRATPALHNGNVISLGATGWLQCLEGAGGEVVWESNLCSQQKDVILFGFASSPLIIEDTGYVSIGNPNPSIVAFDVATGRTKWSMDDRKAGYSSPQPFQHSAGTSILIFDAVGLHAYDSGTGLRQWSFDWGDNSDEQVNVCQPVVLNQNQIMISSGYGRGTCLLEVTQNDGDWSVKQIWKTKRLKSKFASIVTRNGFAYGLDEGILTCIDIKTGQRKWKQGRFGHGQLIRCGDALLIQCESGDLAIVAADSERFVQLQRIEALADRTWNYPVLVGEYILMRNDREAVCMKIN